MVNKIHVMYEKVELYFMPIMYYHKVRKSIACIAQCRLKNDLLLQPHPAGPHTGGAFLFCGLWYDTNKAFPQGEGAPKGRMRVAFPRQTVNGWLRQTGPSSGRFTASFSQGEAFNVKVENHMAKSRGVRGAAGFCAVASLVYLLVRSLLYALVSTLYGAGAPGGQYGKTLGFSEVSLALFQLIIGLGPSV